MNAITNGPQNALRQRRSVQGADSANAVRDLSSGSVRPQLHAVIADDAFSIWGRFRKQDKSSAWKIIPLKIKDLDELQKVKTTPPKLLHTNHRIN
jgi:hypothetical protein